jgi:hypothetical protein
MVRHGEGQFVSPGRGNALSAGRNVPFGIGSGPSPSFSYGFAGEWKCLTGAALRIAHRRDHRGDRGYIPVDL